MASPSKMVDIISKAMIKPSPLPQSNTNNKHCHITPWGLACLSTHYIQWGLLFHNASGDRVVDRLKSSLSAALCHYRPLAGRLQTETRDGGIIVSVDSGAGKGVEFIHATANNVTVADVADDEVAVFVRDFFPFNGAVSYDACLLPLFAAQVTELADGVFLGCSFNHAVGDGTSCLNFLTTWAEICRENAGDRVRERRMVDRWLIKDVSPPIKLPFSNPNEFIDRFSPPPELRERIFHLSSQSMARLKSRANDECNTHSEISALQALCSLIWRSTARARGLPPEQKTSCRLAANNRPRLCPPLPDEYFGCAAVFISVNTTVGELLGHGLGWGAMLVHRSIVAHTDGAIQCALKAWVKTPVINLPSRFDRCGTTIGSSPRFDLYGCDFGWGRAVAVRSGAASKYDGKVATYMGREGKGSVDLEMNLAAEVMSALESDEEFMSVVSPERLLCV